MHLQVEKQSCYASMFWRHQSLASWRTVCIKMKDYVLFNKKNGATSKDYTLIDLDLQGMLSLPKAFA